MLRLSQEDRSWRGYRGHSWKVLQGPEYLLILPFQIPNGSRFGVVPDPESSCGPAHPECPFRNLTYHLIETIRPLIEVHGGVGYHIL